MEASAAADSEVVHPDPEALAAALDLSVQAGDARAARARGGAAARAKLPSARKEACAAVIAEAFPDFAEDADFCLELAAKALTVAGGATGPGDFREALEDALAGVEDEDAVLAQVYDGLLGAGVVRGLEDEAAGATDVAAAGKSVQPGGISRKRFEALFGKELGKRERAAGAHQVSEGALACEHRWDNTGAGGVHCQICNFETKANSYNCMNGCDIKLCGNCWWKWDKKA